MKITILNAFLFTFIVSCSSSLSFNEFAMKANTYHAKTLTQTNVAKAYYMGSDNHYDHYIVEGTLRTRQYKVDKSSDPFLERFPYQTAKREVPLRISLHTSS